MASTSSLDTHRDPLDAARIALTMAASERNGLVLRIKAGEIVSKATITNVVSKWLHASQEFDRLTYATLGVETLYGRTLAAGDAGDLDDAFRHASDRNQFVCEPETRAAWSDHEAGFSSSVGA